MMWMNEYGNLLIEDLSLGIENCKCLLDSNQLDIAEKKLAELMRIYENLVMQVVRLSSSLKILRSFFGAYSGRINNKTYLCRDITNKSWEKIMFLEEKGRELKKIKHRVLYEIGQREYERGKYTKALSYWVEVLKENPGNEQIHHNIRAIILKFSKCSVPQRSQEKLT